MRAPQLSPATYRRITLVAVVLLAVIIVTGAAVRLTDSGLGCPVGITCPEGQLERFAASSEHRTIEYANRMFTGLVSIAVVVAVLGSLVRVPRRRDLVFLSVGLVAGVFAQAILGQLTVHFDLAPQLVMAHFLLSIALLADAIVLHYRAGQADGPARRVVSRRSVVLGRVLVGAVLVVLATGTVVTGAGPHSGGGPHDNVVRIDVPITDVARVHGTAVMVYLALVLAATWLLHRERAPRGVQSHATVLLCVVVAQAAVGYVQYFNDIPPLLVGIHVAGATAVFAATLSLYLAYYEHEPRVAPVEAAADQKGVFAAT